MYKYKEYLDKMISDFSEVADNSNLKVYNRNLDIATYNFEDKRIEVISSGRYLTYRFTEHVDSDVQYVNLFIFRSLQGTYGLVKTREIMKYANYEHRTIHHGYRHEYMINNIHNFLSEVVSEQYEKIDWQEWCSYYDNIISTCVYCGTFLPNTENAREILCGM